MKKTLILCALLLAALLSGCAAEPRKAKRQETHRKLQRHRKKRLLRFEPVSTDSSAPTKAPTEAADPAACIPNKAKTNTGPGGSFFPGRPPPPQMRRRRSGGRPATPPPPEEAERKKGEERTDRSSQITDAAPTPPRPPLGGEKKHISPLIFQHF